MNKFLLFIFGVSLTVSLQAYSQRTADDSIAVRILSEVLVKGVKMENDTRQMMYKPNQSNTTEDVLCHIPGVSLIRRGSYGQEPMIRGLSSGQLNVTIDGMRMFGACTDKMDPVSIYVEPQNLESIEVASGTTGSSMGSSVGGSLDFKLAEPLFSKSVGVQSGLTYHTVSNGVVGYATVNKTQGTSAFRFSSVYRKHDSYTAGDGSTIEYSQYEKLNLNLSGKWGVHHGDTIKADVLTDFGWNIGFPALPMDVGYAQTLLGSVTWSHTRLQNIITYVSTKVYANAVKHIMDDTHRTNVVIHMDMPGESSTFGFFIEGQLRKAGGHHFSFRGDGYYNHSLAEMTMFSEGEPSMYMQTWPATHRMVAGVYAKDIYRLNQKTELEADVRLDYGVTTIEEGIGADQLLIFYPDAKLKRQQVIPATNISLRHFLFPNIQLSVQTGYAQRLPSLSEHAGFYLFNRMDGYDYIGNPGLKNEKAWNTSLVVNYWGKKVDVQVDIFNQNLSDYIFGQNNPELSPMTPGANGVKIYTNIDHVFMRGIETSLSYSPIPALQLMNQTKFVHATMVGGNPLPLIPPFTSQLSVRYAWTSLSLQADTEWAAAQYRINQDFGEDETPAYYLANVRLEYQLKQDKTTWRIQTGVENIFDRYYHAHLDWGNIPRPGRNFYITVECKL